MTDGGSGSGDVRRDQGRDAGQARSSATFGTGPSGDVAPPAVTEHLPRKDRNTWNHRARRASTSAPFPWAQGQPSAPFRDQAQIDGVRRALHFLANETLGKALDLTRREVALVARRQSCLLTPLIPHL